ncbi:bifunctional 4-hydroxy-2-oxoglutarate aldolase/2-dehydro-3-deoxy-phosphogluconate aldolase [Planctomycetales bacterium ZRK34]|nr:bifunctional 4-hydroxy-2-oxoglutarate aldolase/2-dehydro-3-deoxy-phosphogluconate aldolase [Planctomycetales bacterium ZRK34]
MDRQQTFEKIQQHVLVAVIRGDSPQQAVDTAKALLEGGVMGLEIALTTPGGVKAIEQAVREIGDQGIVGAGTVMDADSAKAVIDAGAAFVFAPNVNLDVIAAVNERDRVMVPGALTPTEIATAWAAGVDMVKLFPANHFGPKYIKDIHGPMPDVKITPTGGVDLTTIKAWLDAGAAALGVGSALVKKDLMRAGDWAGLTELARKYTQAVAEAR